MMDHFDLARSFVEQALSGSPPTELASAFERSLERLGFRYFACCSHVNPLKPPPGAVMLHNYPSEWAREFGERKLHKIDPVLAHAERTLLPFHWDSAAFQARMTPTQRQILLRAASYGVRDGYTIPIHLPWTRAPLRASCSVVPDARPPDAGSYIVVQFMALHLYEAASPAPEPPSTRDARTLLSARQRECLELAARGKSNWTIGQILRISKHTVHLHIEAAKRRLGVATRVQAVLGAVRSHQISLGDTIESDLPPAPTARTRHAGRRQLEKRRGQVRKSRP